MREPSEEVLRVGDEFSSSKTALHAIQDYALAERKRVVVDSQGGGHKLVACSSKTCNFFVRLYKRKNSSDDGVSPPWYISSMNLEHMNCTSQPKPTQRQVAEMSALRAAVLADASVSGKSLIKQVQAINMVNLAKHKRMVYRAADAIKENAQGDVTASFTKIPGLLRAFKNLNPGSHACCEVDDVRRFDRAVVVPATSSRAEGHLQKIVGLDGAHSKHQRYNGTMLLLIGRDGNMENVTLAVALVKKETMENYEWFFQQCCLGGLKFAYPLMSDRNTGLINVCKQRGIDHKYCTLHIQRNVIATFTKFTVKQKALVWRIQSCTSMDEYNSQLAITEVECGKPVADYLRGIDPKHWVVFPNLGTTPLYGWRTTNFVEAENGATLAEGLRDLSPYSFLREFMMNLMTDAFKRSEQAREWANKGCIVTPKAMKAYDKQNKMMGEYEVRESKVDVCYVSAVNVFPRVLRRVNLTQKTCTCAFVDQYRIPCRHFIAALSHRGKMELVWGAFGSEYLVTTYVAAFLDACVDVPVESEIDVDLSVLPSPFVRTAGWNPKRRMRSRGEDGNAKVYKCGRCGFSGHNRRSCAVVLE